MPRRNFFQPLRRGRLVFAAHPNVTSEHLTSGERWLNIEADIAVADLPAALTRPVYRLDRSFEQNAADGPDFHGPFAEVPSTPTKDFLGYHVASRIGIAASLLVNERWFELYSRLGFDLLTYKTIRSRERLAHPLPNWLYLDEATPSACGAAVPLHATDRIPPAPLAATAAGSIGMPSSPPDLWRRDLAALLRSLGRAGQRRRDDQCTEPHDRRSRRRVRIRRRPLPGRDDGRGGLRRRDEVRTDRRRYRPARRS
jgi:hypothetical protein